ncbi:hypothetical protein VKT23_015823 [Stygiomarasmius scandens]|uniref:DUF6534 domain-containing protein n=1 Tax=Marasmiellus scandens TaxID=2682957 RepID=A0ABR1J149_9AGAR
MSPVSEAAIPQGIDMASVSGPLIIGELLHWGLFGTLSVQIYLYYMAFPNDKPILKFIAYFVYTMELVQTILVTNDAFHAYGSGFGNYEELTSMHLNWFSIPIMSGIVSMMGQLFFAYRIKVLSNSRVLPAMIAVMAFTTTVAGFITGVCVKEAGRITNLHQLSTKIAVGIWCGVSALCDIFIAACMTYYLSKSADKSFTKTKLLITRLMRLTIETGTATATIALINLILVTGFPDRTYYATASLIIPKTYANTILVILNSRFRIVGGRGVDDDYSNMISTGSMPQFQVQDNANMGKSSMNSHLATVGLRDLNSNSQISSLHRKSSFYDALSPGSTTCASRPGSSGRATIQISIQNEVITDAVEEQTEQSHYSQSSMRSHMKKDSSNVA